MDGMDRSEVEAASWRPATVTSKEFAEGRPNVESHDGWHSWRMPQFGGTKLHELRMEYIARSEQPLDGEP